MASTPLQALTDDDSLHTLVGTPSYQQQAASPTTSAGTPSTSDPLTSLQPSTGETAAPQKGAYADPNGLAPNETTIGQPSTGAPNAPSATTDGTPDAGLDELGQLQKQYAAAAPTDETTRNSLREQIATTVYSQLEQAGHTVSWQDNNTLLVDGRAYTLNAAPATSASLSPAVQQTKAALSLNGTPGSSSAYPTDLGGWQKYSGSANDSSAIAAFAQWAAQQPGADPSVAGQLDYLEQRIAQTGGLTASNIGYWQDRVMQGKWTAPETGGATSPTGVSEGFTLPAPPAITPIPSQPSNVAPFTATAPGYTPGDIPTSDLPNLSYDQLMGDLGHFTAGDLSSLDPNATDASIESEIQALLANPTSLSDQAVAEMKAKAKDQISGQAKDDADNLLRTSYAQGIGDSSFLADEQLAAQRARDSQLASSNQNIDLTAAQTRASDTRAALGAASSAESALANQRLGAAQLKTSAGEAAAASQQNQVSTAVQAQLNQAAATTNRLQLRESVKQQAASLGLSADQLQLQYTQSLINDATQRYGIDQETALKLQTLAQSSYQSAESLALELVQLQQQDQQFGATYGLNVTQENDQQNNSQLAELLSILNG